MNSIPDPTPEEKRYWVALALTPKVGPVLFRAILSHTGTALNFFNLTQENGSKLPKISRKLAEIRNQQASLLRLADTLLNKQASEGYRLLTSLDADFPKRLESLPDAPVLLFTQGESNLNPDKTIGIVGTRSATSYGRSIAKKIIEDLLPYRPTIVSGLAYGIDVEAHRAALSLELPTWAIMGTPISHIYPAAHRGIAEQIKQAQGTLISEYAPGSRLLPGNFPARNRIIAGLSDALIVVEAAVKGGALITAEIAFSYQKEVFAVPGNLQSTFSEGCNQLIKRMKASIYTGPEDLAVALHWGKEGERKKIKAAPDFSKREGDEKTILLYLQQQGESEVDRIAYDTEIPQGQLASKLLSLEFEGIVKSLPGKKFKLLS